MTAVFRIILLFVCIGTFALIMQKIRHAKMRIEDAVFWVLLCVMLLIFAIFPAIPDWMAGMLGIYSTPNFLFLFLIFILILKIFSMSLHLSALERRLTELAQAQALEVHDVRARKEVQIEEMCTAVGAEMRVSEKLEESAKAELGSEPCEAEQRQKSNEAGGIKCR